MASVLHFVEQNVDLNNIARAAAVRFPLETCNFCSSEHKQQFELLYVQLMLRVHCKQANVCIRDSRRFVKKIGKVFT